MYQNKSKMEKLSSLNRWNQIEEGSLEVITRGKWVKWYSTDPYVFYRNTKTKATRRRQVMSTADYVAGTVAAGWAKCFLPMIGVSYER